ncbi:MAG: ribonuclease HII, partial [Hyphomicrobiaceae bacterium]
MTTGGRALARLKSAASPDFSLEHAARASFAAPIAGVDEAGRGPLAGPVVAAAVILDEHRCPAGVNDSKTLSEAQREQLFIELQVSAIIGVGIVDVAQIDQLNILQATLLAMRKAVAALDVTPVVALIDGNRAPILDCQIRTVVRGDARSLTIAAASIIAKVTRDHTMRALAERHPGYGWQRNMGYGTPEHKAALASLGATP